LDANHLDIASEIAAGSGLSLAQAARRFPSFRGGRPCNPSTVFRWATTGIVAQDGKRIRLEAARLNGRYLTTEAAIARFIAAQTPVRNDDAPLPQTPAEHHRGAERTRRELDRIGI
jgi:hypothetical protein